jgi:hypothetical protein
VVGLSAFVVCPLLQSERTRNVHPIGKAVVFGAGRSFIHDGHWTVLVIFMDARHSFRFRLRSVRWAGVSFDHSDGCGGV